MVRNRCSYIVRGNPDEGILFDPSFQCLQYADWAIWVDDGGIRGEPLFVCSTDLGALLDEQPAGPFLVLGVGVSEEKGE